MQGVNNQWLYSHSMVAGGLLVMSYSTLLTAPTSLQIRLAHFCITSYGILYQSAVIASALVTARSVQTSL